MLKHMRASHAQTCHSSLLCAPSRGNLTLHQAEAGDFIMKLATDVTKGLQPPVDLLFVDVFDGEDNVPASLRCAGTQQILPSCCKALHFELCLHRQALVTLISTCTGIVMNPAAASTNNGSSASAHWMQLWQRSDLAAARAQVPAVCGFGKTHIQECMQIA